MQNLVDKVKEFLISGTYLCMYIHNYIRITKTFTMCENSLINLNTITL